VFLQDGTHLNAEIVTLEELLMSSLPQTDALAKLLIEKSVINYA